MADASHLERMGRELKCPICLSLLSSAVSLTCNHVFCNSCILKSMRLDSHCPMCKVPCRRREVRPAPHMDNLVNIYKNMEIASGINIFVTQNAPPAKTQDEEKRGEGVSNSSNPDWGRACSKKAASKGKSHKESKSKLKSSGCRRVKPSFPTNKRVQVPRSPLPETPMQLMNSKSEGDEAGNRVPNSEVPNNYPTMTANCNQLLKPLFWLREDESGKLSQRDDDEGKLSQPTDVDHLTFTPVNTPNFSDIKDSDDDIPGEVTPKAEVSSRSNVADIFNSEMFEWTQRACSPELCSTPIRMQVSSGDDDEKPDKVLGTPSEGGAGVRVPADNFDRFNSPERSRAKNSSAFHDSQTKIVDKPTGCGKSRKRNRKGRIRSQNKRTKKSPGNDVDTKLVNRVVPDAERGPAFCESSYNVDVTSTKASENNPDASVQAELLNQVDDYVASKLPASSCIEQGRSKGMTLRNGRSSNIINPCQRKKKAKSKEQKSSFAKLDQSKGVTPSQQQQCCGSEMSTVPKLSTEAPREKESSIRVDNFNGSSTRCKSRKCVQELKCGANMGVIKDTTDKQDDGRISSHAELVDPTGPDHSVEAGNIVASKRKSNSNRPPCAFCHSAEETEFSGEMIHYFQGKPVSSDYNGGSCITHSHKICTEWAPNVYFEEDIAINLEEELARSRRIKCSLCGIKGAALGCYDKGCRRSFHVPCAKRLRRSRWDTDNFVMLCPLHASSKLPKEQSGAQLKRRKNNVKRQSEASIKHESHTRLWSSCGRSDKLHLCCSALVTGEKEIVTEFKRLSGASVSKNWNPSVTHVIASTDENGAFRRTLKVLMGILEGKWILSIEWIKACLTARRVVDETAYEINVDTHGIKGGPRLGRLRLGNKQPKLFAGLRFHLTGDFQPSYKGYLHDLITSAGGTILHRKPRAEDHGNQSTDCSLSSIIIYSLELPDQYDINKKDMILSGRQAEAEALAKISGSKVASNLWVLNCISGYKLQPLQGSML